MPGYIVAQIIWGIAAASFLRAMFGAIGLLGATTPGPGGSDFKALAMEVLLTTGLVSTILGTSSGARIILVPMELSRSVAILLWRAFGRRPLAAPR